jgi:hypothetical protein
MSDSLDPYHLWLGIPPGEQPPTPYRLLGLRPFESDPEVIANAADRQTLHLRTFQLGEQSELSERLLNEVAAARVTLLDLAKKARYDEQLRARSERVMVAPVSAQPAPSSKPALLGIPRPVPSTRLRSTPRRRRRWLPRWMVPAAVVVILAAALVLVLYYTTAFFFRSGRESAPPEPPVPPAETEVLPPVPPAPPAAKPKPPIVIDSPTHRPPPSGPVGNQRKSP